MKSQLRHCLLVLATFVFISPPGNSESASATYYYLHVASFRSEKSAAKSVKHLKRNNVNTVIRKEKVANKGDWYRVYVGPYPTRAKAEEVSRKLKDKKAITYASIQKKDALLTPPAEPKTEPAVHKPDKAAAATTSRSAPPPVVVPAPKPAARQAPATTKTAAPAEQKTAAGKAKTEQKKSASIVKRLKGRNARGGQVAIGYKHTYTEIDTVVTSRTQIESTGTTTITDVPLTDAEKERFPTSMHLDTFIFGYGFTDFFEVFGEVGVSYDDSISDAGLAWGGGLRLNLFQTRASGNNPAFYGALQGEYYSGEFEKDFTSAQGNKFRRETEWQEATARAEIGLNHPRFNLYGGGTYFYYREDTDRQQLNNLPPGVSSLTLKDQLEPQNEFGAYGGVSFFFTPKFLINIEGRAIDMTAISGSLEYRF